MTRAEEIVNAISFRNRITGAIEVAPVLLATYLATLESSKGEETGLLEAAYRHGGKEGLEYAQSSEEKKCEETFEAANLKGRCKLLEGHEGIHQPELVSPTQEEKKCACDGPISCLDHMVIPASPTPPDAWEKLTDYINQQLEESHNEGTYKYDWLYEDILKKIEELRANP